MTDVLLGTRERLLRAAREVIEQAGYGGASVAAIAERASVATGTLYRHFASKEELFVELFRSVCEGEEQAMRAAIPPAGGALERLQAILGTFAHRALRNRRLAWALIAEPVDHRVDAERLVYRERYAGIIAEALEQGIVKGEIPDQDVRFTAAALVGGCGEALVGPLSPVGTAPASEQVLAALDSFVRRAVGG